MKTLALLLVLGCAGALAAVSLARPSSTALVATVGPGFSIKLTKDGAAVKNLPAGDYTITVHDLSAEHDFHLAGGGISKATGEVAGEVHELSAFLLIALILLHVAAALKHQFVDKWRGSARMPPFNSFGEPVAIGQGDDRDRVED